MEPKRKSATGRLSRKKTDKNSASKSKSGKKTYSKKSSGSSSKKRTSTKSRSPQPDSSTIRLNKFLADCGVCSRRKADEFIDEGNVKVNGKTVYELGVRIDPNKDNVTFKGKSVKFTENFRYFSFYKPKQVVTTTEDPLGRPTVIDYFRRFKLRLFPVGRLDWDSEGLLLVTNDGDFSQQVIHPRQEIIKVYHAKLSGVPTNAQLEKLKKGVSIIGGKVAAVQLKRLPKSTDKKAWIEIGIVEGKNRQVKKMFEKIGYDVEKLRRVSIGGLTLLGLKPGEHKELKASELMRIFKNKKIPQ